MENELTEELRVLVSAEVDKAIKGLKDVDNSTKKTESNFKLLGKTISAAFVAKEIINFGKQSALAFEESQRNISVLNATLQATGANAWTSSKQIQDMASSLQSLTNYDDDSIIKMQTVLLGFKNITGDSFEHATKAILDMATVMDMDLSSAAQAVGKALDDPINGITSLQRQGFRFSDSQKAVIQSLIDTGDVAAAQKIILDELDSTYGGAAESAVRNSIKIKNAFEDLKEGFGKFFQDIGDGKAGEGIAKVFEVIGEAAGSFGDNVKYLHALSSEDAFTKYFDSLEDADKKIEVATERVSYYGKQISELKKKLEDPESLSDFARELDENLLAEATYLQKFWYFQAEQVKNDQKIISQIQTEENERLTAESAIKELMHSIAVEYEKLSKDDPVVQLQNYQKQLEEIEKNKKTLAADTTGKDVSESLKQLDYNADAIKKKIKELRDKMQEDGIKSWQKYFEDATGVSESSFTTGKEAADLYISGLKESFSKSKSIAELLGENFDDQGVLEDQLLQIQTVITDLLNIPAAEIDEAYSESDNSIKLLIDHYKELNKQKKEFEVADSLKDLQERVDNLTKSERELYIETLNSKNATDEQIQEANRLFDIIENNSKDSVSWDDFLEEKLLSGIEKLNLFKENADETNKSLAGLGASLSNLTLGAAVTGIETLGKALGEGKNAGDSMKAALVAMSQTILDQLPTLFLQAGLQLIAQGQWPLGLGLITAGLSTTFINGLNQGYQERFKENAFGGVYGSSDYEAFAKGGTFTNQIINRPTLFRFASGSGFGTGLMGEAGPEAVMPLTRSADGRLGIDASGSGSYVQVLLEVNNYSAEKVQTRESTDDSGQKKIQIMIGSAINSHLSSGKADKALSARYGLKVQGV